MLTHRELKAMPEYARIAQELGEMFVEHTNKAVSEEHEIGEVRYHKGWIDAINEFIDIFERLFPEPDEVRDAFAEETMPGDSIIVARKDGSVY